MASESHIFLKRYIKNKIKIKKRDFWAPNGNLLAVYLEPFFIFYFFFAFLFPFAFGMDTFL